MWKLAYLRDRDGSVSADVPGTADLLISVDSSGRIDAVQPGSEIVLPAGVVPGLPWPPAGLTLEDAPRLTEEADTGETWTCLIYQDAAGRPARLFAEIVRDEAGQPRRLTCFTLQRLLRYRGIVQAMSEAVSSKVGRDYLEATLDLLTRLARADAGFIGRLKTDCREIETVAVVSLDPDFPDAFTYHLAGTPCDVILRNGTACVYSGNVQQAYPDDQLLVDLGVNSYAGVALTGAADNPFGLIVLLRQEAFPDPGVVLQMMHLFSDRVGAEIERLDAQRTLVRSEERLRRQNDALVRLADWQANADAHMPGAMDWMAGLLCDALGAAMVQLWLERSDVWVCVSSTRPDDQGRRFGVASGGDAVAALPIPLDPAGTLQPVERIPLNLDGVAVGAILVQRSEGHRAATADSGFLTGAAGLLSVALGAARRRQALEAAQAADRAKAEFLDILSHELRTPLNAVVGFTDLLAGSAAPGPAREYAEHIRDGGRRLEELVTSVLEFVRLGSRDRGLDEVRFSLADLVQECLRPYRQPIEARGCRVELDLDAGLRLCGDDMLLRRAVSLLLQTAIAVLRPGACLSVTVRSVAGGGARLTIATEPSQGDIPALVTGRDGIVRGTGRRSHGDGLDLRFAIVDRIAQLHGGCLFRKPGAEPSLLLLALPPFRILQDA